MVGRNKVQLVQVILLMALGYFSVKVFLCKWRHCWPVQYNTMGLCNCGCYRVRVGITGIAIEAVTKPCWAFQSVKGLTLC